jgi:hypothetical protein
MSAGAAWDQSALPPAALMIGHVSDALAPHRVAILTIFGCNKKLDFSIGM